MKTEHAERAWRAQESEGPIVLVKRVMTVEGRGPGSECFTRSGRVGDWREPEDPQTAEELPGKLYAKAKAVRMKPKAPREICPRAGCGKSARPVR